MIGLVLALLVVGILMAFIKPLVEPMLFNIALAVVVICVVIYLASAFGVLDVPIPRLRP